MVKTLATRKINGRTMYVLDDRKLKKGDVVWVRAEDGTLEAATVTSKDTLSFAVSRNGGEG